MAQKFVLQHRDSNIELLPVNFSPQSNTLQRARGTKKRAKTGFGEASCEANGTFLRTRGLPFSVTCALAAGAIGKYVLPNFSAKEIKFVHPLRRLSNFLQTMTGLAKALLIR